MLFQAGVMLLSIAAMITALALRLSLDNSSSRALPLFFFGVSAFLGIAISLFHIFRVWSFVQDGYARTSPLKAMAYMLLPFFNLYWIFVVVHGFARDYNSLIQRKRLSAPPLPHSLHLGCCVLFAASALPYVGVAASFLLPVAWLLVMGSNCRAVSRLSPYV